MKPFFTTELVAWELSVSVNVPAPIAEPWSLMRVGFAAADGGDRSPNVWVELTGSTARVVFDDGAGESRYTDPVEMKPGAFARVALRFDPRTARLALALDGQAAGETPVPTARIGVGRPSFNVGYIGSMATPHRFDLDDFAVKRLP